jgi:hypothetical protein
LSVQFVLSIYRRQCFAFFGPTAVREVKKQLAVRLLPQLFCHISHLNLPGRTAFEPVEDNLYRCQSVPAA